MPYHLYHTLGCHLCEQAETVIQSYNRVHGLTSAIEYIKIDIADNDALVEKFGVRIPVLEMSGDYKTLDWPFDVHSLAQFVLECQK